MQGEAHRGVRWILVFLIPLHLPSNLLQAAGMRTHVEMSRRAIDHHHVHTRPIFPELSDLLDDDRNRAAYYWGAVFPDWGYTGQNPDAAEEAHWKPFHDAHERWIQKNCMQPWDAESKRQVAFFLGIVAHGIQDIPWHFDREGHSSLLRQTWNHDQLSHSGTEYSYDLLLHTEGPRARQLIPEFWTPVETIVDVYRDLGREVPSIQVNKGVGLQQVAMETGPIGGFLSIRNIRDKYRWLVAHTDGYYFGGVENGGALTAVWDRFYFARLLGHEYLQNIPLFCGDKGDDRLYQGCSDLTVSSRKPKANAGWEPILVLSAGDPNEQAITCMRFDLEKVASRHMGRRLTRATLAVAVHQIGDAPSNPSVERDDAAVIELIPVPQSWTEGEGMSSAVDGMYGRLAEAGESTWENSTIIVEALKSAPATQSVPLAEFVSGQRWLAFDVTALAQDWLARPEDNHGVAFRVVGRDVPRIEIFSSQAYRTALDGMGGGDRIARRPFLLLRFENRE